MFSITRTGIALLIWLSLTRISLQEQVIGLHKLPENFTGPNICRSRTTSAFCCPGWTKRAGSGLCVIPLCARRCGPGRCIRPNICLCESGLISSSCNMKLHRSHTLSTNETTRKNSSTSSLCDNGIRCIHGECDIDDGKCKCEAGYQGKSCHEPICHQNCLNQGRCIGPDRCACVFGFTGKRCETDYRTGPCYTKLTNNLCSASLESVLCTRQLCCATVGKAWGHPCTKCPARLNCETGYIKTMRNECIDINECDAIPGLCKGGKCLNTPGSFNCECEDGQTRDFESNKCVDKDECQQETDICSNGQCVNTVGGYYCLCNPGFIQNQDKKHCIDGRQGSCYLSIGHDGKCSRQLHYQLTKQDCCCGKNMGKGWGEKCYICPLIGSESHKKLCTMPQNLHIDECSLRPDICVHGQCVDTEDGYDCNCHSGYEKTRNGLCEDIDECKTGFCKGGTCKNTEGSFVCDCPPGYVISEDGKYCSDHDECKDSGMCTNGICTNINGSFRCKCNDGFSLLPSTNVCIDIDECAENSRICLNGQCENTPGSYQCLCETGFTSSRDKTFCVDMDECSASGMCNNGMCVNMEGSFKCVCDPGFKLSSDSVHCIDIDECQSSPCQGGRCTNVQGSYKCECGAGYYLGPDGKTCLDTRRDLCFSEYRNGSCINPASTAVTKSSCCCCTVISGKLMAWGTDCQPCPSPGSPEFDHLCPHGAGMTYNGDDINECAQNPNVCKNGGCDNLMGTYRCICDRGYSVDLTGKICSDINECEIEESLCTGGQCKNTPGSFQCICPSGSIYNFESRMCEDVDECVDEAGQEVCINGICINTFGSYECECESGSILDNTGRVCIDNRKGSCWSKIHDSRCENSMTNLALKSECCCSVGLAWGSPCEICVTSNCECEKGYAKLDGKTCVDIDECELDTSICKGGVCINSEGSYRCDCPPGLILDPTLATCIDVRVGNCYMEQRHGRCFSPIEGKYSKSKCCCSVGHAWGDTNCESCPKLGTRAFAELCSRGAGFGDKQDINECVEFPTICQNGRCTNTLGSYTCKCNPGYVLNENSLGCNDIDECSIMYGVCGNGTCRNIPGHFECDCHSGYKSSDVMKVCMDINECDDIPGLCRGGTCVNIDGSYDCICPSGHELAPDKQSCKDIDECSRTSGICSNGACENMMGTYQCICDDGFRQTLSKTHCEDINECLDNNAGCEEICINTSGSFYCTCRSGSALNTDGRSCYDINECIENERICNGGECTNLRHGYACTCGEGLLINTDGTSCIDRNECTSNINVCGFGVCKNTMGSFECTCENGFSVKPQDGPACTDDDECMLDSHSCSEFAKCRNTVGSFECTCHNGFVGNGFDCRDINECLKNNGGCDANAQCINTEGSFKCACDAGFEGDGYLCKDVDECGGDTSLCENGRCFNYPGSFRCECDMGFVHPDENNEQACIDIDECELFNNLCENGRCENIFGMFRCECNEGYKLDSSGGNCTDINECENPQSCQYGKCINTRGSYICQCPPDYYLVETGNACIDQRESICYAGHYYPDGKPRCLFDVISSVTKAKCCCSIGNAWGPRCEPCPQRGSEEFEKICPGGSGYAPNLQTVVLEDINECEEHYETVCLNGHCTNTFGSFMCSCDEGFVLDQHKISCVDIDECALHPNICGVGICINDKGKYHCECPEGYMTMPGGKECVDMRKETCYTDYKAGQCINPMMHPQTRMLCCCSMGAAWGNPCQKCPGPKSRDHEMLCGKVPGQIINPITNHSEEIDECILMPTMCTHGRCVNTPGSFECWCDRGYDYDEASHQCVDRNECQQVPNPCSANAQCINRQGYFECSCPLGYNLTPNKLDCVDIDECTERNGICANGLCNNFQGSFQCSCHSGYASTRNRDACVDIDECQRHSNICHNGTCINVLGSYKCECYDGFKLSLNHDCIDVDECRIMPFLCRNGRCRNTVGSFYCECADGYVLAPDAQHCRDVDECHETPGLCPFPGKCQNIMGSFICSCPPGYELNRDKTQCFDVDECAASRDICENGQCINTEGGVICECPIGFKLSEKPNVLKCTDVREGSCYDKYRYGDCSAPRTNNLTKKHCCCTMGQAWGKNCEKCPHEATEEFNELCPEGAGRDDTGIDLNECMVLSDVCSGGVCINTDGSFRCECPIGYILDSTKNMCIDQNECIMEPNICLNGTCTNLEGGFQCSCNEGYTPGVDQTCEDVNECIEMINTCAFRCHNTPGSFKCLCPFGYTLATDERHCIDVDECSYSSNGCKFECKNLIGSFMCICPPGYKQIGTGGDNCEDVDECSLDSELCRNGECVNLEGSYRCICYAGYEISKDGKDCIDRRVGHCYPQITNGHCTAQIPVQRTVTKADCCCTIGTAWGDSCEICPAIHTDSHKRLCLDKGFSVDGQDIDECKNLPELCRNGECVNTLGSYRCICDKGYKIDNDTSNCIDINECDSGVKICEYHCQNTEGSYICSCPTGYVLTADGVTCRDLDECTIGTHICQQICINTLGSYTCECREGYNQHRDGCHDINECEFDGCCPKPGTCINTLGSFKCICPRGFRLDDSGKFCIDMNECANNSSCKYGCQNFMGSYRCGCPRGYIQHLYQNQCIDENECNDSPCGLNSCINTLGSFECDCPDGYKFDQTSANCIEITDSCNDSPCVFDCMLNELGSFLCGCPDGYQRIGQGHCLSTVTPLIDENRDDEEISNVPTYSIDSENYRFDNPSNEKIISTEGCFSCKINKNEKDQGKINQGALQKPITSDNRQKNRKKRSRRIMDIVEPENNSIHNLKVTIFKTVPQKNIIKLQSSRKDITSEYILTRGNEQNIFGIVKNQNVWELFVRKHILGPTSFDLEIRDSIIKGNASEAILKSSLNIKIHIDIKT